VSQDNRDKIREKGLRHRRRADQPWDTRSIYRRWADQGGSPDRKSKLKLLISPKVTTTPFCGEQASPSAVPSPGTRDAVSSSRSTWTHHPAIIKATGPHHPTPTSTLAWDCSGRARSCPPATQHRKPSDPQCEPYENQLNNIPVKSSTCVKLIPPLRSFTALCTNPGLLNKKGCNSTFLICDSNV
jgi:hypothetical protein